MSFRLCTPVPLMSVFPYLPSNLANSPAKENKTKTLPGTLWSVPQYIYPFAPTASLANVHCTSLWSGSRPLASAVLSILESHWDSLAFLLFPCVMETLQFWICRNSPFHMLQQCIDEVDVGVSPGSEPGSAHQLS